MLKKGIIPTILFIMVMIGCIIVNIKNTEALSPFGNTIDNYQIVTKEFGEDFSEFIKDKANIKIYLNKEQNNLPYSITYILEEMINGINRDLIVLKTMI